MTDSVQRAGELLGRVARGLDVVSGNAKVARDLLALLGWSLPPGVDDIGLTQLDLSTLAARLDTLSDLRSQEDASDADIAVALAGVADALIEFFEHAQQLAAGFEATPEYLQTTQIVDEFFPRLADVLVIQLVGQTGSALIPLGVLLGLFEMTRLPADPAKFQVEHVRQVVRWDRFGPLLKRPGRTC